MAASCVRVRVTEMVGLRHPSAARATAVFGLGLPGGHRRRSRSAAVDRYPVDVPERHHAAFVVVVIGGLGSFAGAVIAGLLVGVVTALTIQFQPDAATAMMYVFMAAVLLVHPRGLLGERWERFE